MTAEDGVARVRRPSWRRLETVAVVLVALHSYAVGAVLLFLTEWSLRFAGWGVLDSLFFARQSGAFHFVVATAYLVEYARTRGITVLITAKTVAVVFLLALSPWETAWAIKFSGVADGLMLVGMIFLHIKARGETAS